ncbi:MAG TPA: RNA-binding protein [Candidatus Krumholzibacteria bacterium]
MRKIYVGNLPFNTREEQLRQLFAPFGVHSVQLATHGGALPRGFGYVEIEDQRADEAVSALNGYQLEGRRLMVNKLDRDR